jgi:hypothetical protein
MRAMRVRRFGPSTRLRAVASWRSQSLIPRPQTQPLHRAGRQPLAWAVFLHACRMCGPNARVRVWKVWFPTRVSGRGGGGAGLLPAGRRGLQRRQRGRHQSQHPWCVCVWRVCVCGGLTRGRAVHLNSPCGGTVSPSGCPAPLPLWPFASGATWYTVIKVTRHTYTHIHTRTRTHTHTTIHTHTHMSIHTQTCAGTAPSPCLRPASRRRPLSRRHNLRRTTHAPTSARTPLPETLESPPPSHPRRAPPPPFSTRRSAAEAAPPAPSAAPPHCPPLRTACCRWRKTARTCFRVQVRACWLRLMSRSACRSLDRCHASPLSSTFTLAHCYAPKRGPSPFETA